MKLTRLASTTWNGLRAEQVERWLWIDTTGVGVHLEAALPERPTQVTHVWGWTGSWAVRARIDPDLGDGTSVGVRAARLRWSGAAVASDLDEEDATPIESTNPVWKIGNDRASMPLVSGLSGEKTAIDLVTLQVHRAVDAGDQVTFVPLTFVRT